MNREEIAMHIVFSNPNSTYIQVHQRVDLPIHTYGTP